jgi:hypothetical protein
VPGLLVALCRFPAAVPITWNSIMLVGASFPASDVRCLPLGKKPTFSRGKLMSSCNPTLLIVLALCAALSNLESMTVVAASRASESRCCSRTVQCVVSASRDPIIRGIPPGKNLH